MSKSTPNDAGATQEGVENKGANVDNKAPISPVSGINKKRTIMETYGAEDQPESLTFGLIASGELFHNHV